MKGNNGKVFELLKIMHQNAECELNFATPFQLLIAVILSAQCTDKRVNEVTKKLFSEAYAPEHFVAMSQEELEQKIFSCGFYRNKAKAIKDMSKSVIELGAVPATIEGLMQLSGVGRKTANVVFSVAFGGNAIAVDTHVFRVSNRIGLSKSKTPEECERQLMQAFDAGKWSLLHHLLIFHGRYVCTAKKPECDICMLKDHCDYYKNNTK